jgi:hypothetical protein
MAEVSPQVIVARMTGGFARADPILPRRPFVGLFDP